jgi:hypothetical protein
MPASVGDASEAPCQSLSVLADLETGKPGNIGSTIYQSCGTSLDALKHYDYFPIQKVLKIRLRMSSVVVAPVISSSGCNAL